MQFKALVKGMAAAARWTGAFRKSKAASMATAPSTSGSTGLPSKLPTISSPLSSPIPNARLLPTAFSPLGAPPPADGSFPATILVTPSDPGMDGNTSGAMTRTASMGPILGEKESIFADLITKLHATKPTNVPPLQTEMLLLKGTMRNTAVCSFASFVTDVRCCR